MIKDEAEIVKNKREIIEPLWGVYFLIKDDRIVYVGSSNSCVARVWVHLEYGEKEFDSWSFLEIKDNADRAWAERMYIKKFKPKYNSVLYINETFTPTRMEGVIRTFKSNKEYKKLI